MRLIKFKRASWVAVMAMLALPGAMITSCSKENPTENVVPKGDKLTISVLGINDGNEDSGNKAKASTARSSFAQAAADYKVYEFADADMAVSVGNNLPVKKAKTTVSSRTHSGLANSGTKAAEEMESGMKYVVYIYDGTTLAGAAELEAGTPGTIEGLDMNGEYSWVAVSYNSNDAAPGLAPTDGVIDLPENTDVLYASGTVDLATDPNIGITFNHAFARIGIELNTIGAFGEITGTPLISVSGLELASGSMNLISGEITAGDTYEPTLTYADFENVDPEYDDAKIAYVYTIGTSALNLTASLQDLTITHVDNVDGVVNRVYFAGSPASTNANVTPVAGMSHRVALNVVESGLTTNYNGNTVQWGRSNLYYRGDNGGDRNYAFYSENKQTARADGFFGFGGTIAGQFATSATQGDPCALVYPAGLWRQPTKADFNDLVRGDIELGELTEVLGPLGQAVDATGITGIIDLLTNLLGNAVAVLVNTEAPNSALEPTSPYTYGQYEIAAGAPQSGENAFGDADNASNNLRFYYNGQISDLTVLSQLGNGGGLIGLGLNDLTVDLLDQNIIDLGVPLLDSYGDLTSLWTNQQGTNILGLAGAGSWAYLGNAGRGIETNFLGIPTGFNARFHMANNTGELLNGVEALGVDVLSTTLKNVRCVRAN